MPPRCIEPATAPLEATIRATPSKSATHRALVAAAIADGESTISNPLEADDTRATRDGLIALGIPVETVDRMWVVRGGGGKVPGGAALELGASGTSARFLTALAAMGTRASRLDGSDRLRARPLDELVGGLRRLGARIDASDGGFLPLTAGGSEVSGGSLSLSGARSSQFASALLLVAPSFTQGLTLLVTPPRVSWSYVLMTVEILRKFRLECASPEEGAFVVGPHRLVGTAVEIEGDHSSASYLLAAAAILGGRVRVEGLRGDSLQPDVRFLADLRGLGCNVRRGRSDITVEGSGRIPPFAWDLSDAPDLAPTAAALALFAEGPSTLSGLSHLRWKESDRVAVLAANLERLGAKTTVEPSSLRIEPPPPGAEPVTVHVAGDHRIAMAFAVAGLRRPGIVLDDPGVVSKSYPRFWQDFETLRTGSSSRN